MLTSCVNHKSEGLQKGNAVKAGAHTFQGRFISMRDPNAPSGPKQPFRLAENHQF